MTSTLVVSDLHLGTRSGVDLARREKLREPLLRAIEKADQLVLLGDILELRDGPRSEALAAARGFFSDVGEALGDRRVVLVAGNHDHALIAPWVRRRLAVSSGSPPLGLEETVPIAEAAPELAEVAAWLGSAPLDISYPGLWLRPDVYATHGHYLDRHVSVPSLEPLALRAIERVLRRSARDDGVAGYEAIGLPFFALLDELAQNAPARAASGGSGVSHRAYRVLVGDGTRRRPLRHRLVALAGFPAVIAALNRAGLGPVRADLSAPELRRAALLALGDSLAALGVEARHVVFGHTHRAGPFAGDRDPEWSARTGARLVNCGSWVYDPLFLTRTPNESPYWPGTAVRVEDAGPPVLQRLLGHRTHDDLRSELATR